MQEVLSPGENIYGVSHKNFVSMGPNIDKRIPSAKTHYNEYMKNIKVNNKFFLKPTNSTGIFLDLCKVAKVIPVF